MLEDFHNKNVLITGHTGFKGSWLAAIMTRAGASVVGISLDIVSEPSHFPLLNLGGNLKDIRLDIRDGVALKKVVKAFKPDYVFHLAAQSLVRKSYGFPADTWSTNLMGTLNLLEACRELEAPCNVVIVTSDKCYDNVEWIWGYRETDRLGGVDPYSASKGATEILVRSYVHSYFKKNDSSVRIATARAGNVIGGGDWAVDRIVPDCMRAWARNEFVEIRNPFATRPWQHVLEPLSGYWSLALALQKDVKLHGESFNFGPPPQNNHTVKDLVDQMSYHWDKVKWVDSSAKEKSAPHEAGLLKLNCDKALSMLLWEATLDFKQTALMTAEWYRDFYRKDDLGECSDLTYSQIDKYFALAKTKKVNWAL
jgi:CDP-glucose 4,6-dehydratase